MTKAFLEVPQNFMLLQPTDKCARNVRKFLQKDYKLLQGVKMKIDAKIYFLKNIFRNIKIPQPYVRSAASTGSSLWSVR